jgi:iron-sulfur cluster repair protein YtfE (RIC family)
MDAIQLLKRDHDQFRALLGKLEETSDRAVKARTALFHALKAELLAHETIEEEILYPTMAEHRSAEDIVAHSYEEHHVIDLLLDELDTLAFDDDAWSAKAHVLKENLEHHLGDEEEDLFPKALRLLSTEVRAQLGDEMEERQDDVLETAIAHPHARAAKPRG